MAQSAKHQTIVTNPKSLAALTEMAKEAGEDAESLLYLNALLDCLLPLPASLAKMINCAARDLKLIE